jgi:hypothetical protein
VKRLGRRPGAAGQRHVGGIWIDDDQAIVLVCAGRGTASEGLLRFDRETTTSDLAATLVEAEAFVAAIDRAAGVDWTLAIGGGDVIHDVITVPPQVRAFRDVRLEACLAGTSWGSADAIEAAGYRLGHAFDGDRCLIGVVPRGTLGGLAELRATRLEATSSAVALLELIRAVDAPLFEPGAPAAMALLCGAASVAACVVENGEVRLLHQLDLAAYAREFAAAPQSPASDGPLEYELGGQYSVPSAGSSARRLGAEGDAAAIETGAYQAAVTRIIQDVLGLYREQYGTAVDCPRRLLLTGEGVPRHALHAFAVRYLGTQFDVDELDAALLVRIDDPETARRFAALQSTFGGALAAVAAGNRPDALAFPVEPGEPEPVQRGRGRRRSAPWWTPRRMATAAVAATLLVLGLGARLAFVTSDQWALEASLAEEQARQIQLSAVTAERKEIEARLGHTRELLEALSSMRGRQALPPELLATVAACLPAEARLDEIELSGSTLRLVGDADDREVGMRLALALEQRRDAFADVVPQTETKIVEIADAETGEPTKGLVYTFAITTKYARNTATPSERKATGEKGR